MLKKIRVMLDYRCYPVWLYDEDGDIIDTLLPEELRDLAVSELKEKIGGKYPIIDDIGLTFER